MEAIKDSIWWILWLPLIGFLVQAFCGGVVTNSLGAKKGRAIMGWLAFAPIFIGFLIALGITRTLAGEHGDTVVLTTLFDWIKLQGITIPFELRADSLSMTMTLVITGVGSLIHMYAIKYMADEKDFTRFFTYMNLFIAFMLLLVLGNNLAMLFIGWEGVGLCSYLLIGFWYKDHANAKAANKAFIVNRIGDWGLTLGIFLLIVLAVTNRESLLYQLPTIGADGITQHTGALVDTTRWLSYDVLLPRINDVVNENLALATMAGIFLFIGAMGKSAQFPLYVWLPDAMAGPTPVSALIHAATMVTAGVYLLARMAPLFDLIPVAQTLIVVIGAVTALVGALIAFGQTDIKKVLAFSTVSQLGYMFIACGVGAYWAGIFHVVTHAFFKALLFLGAGAVIYAMKHNQDMRNYGNLRKYIKITFGTMFVGWAAIAGIPFLFSGAYSKEAILGAAVNQPLNDFMIGPLTLGQAAGWVGFFVAMLTAAYMTRMMMQTFGAGEERWRLLPAGGHEAHHEEPLADFDHGEDKHSFFYTNEEMAALPQEHDHHHELDKDHEPKEVPWEMWLPLVVLAIAATGISGLLLGAPEAIAEMIPGVDPHFMQHWLYPAASGEEHHLLGFTQLLGISVGVALIGILYGYFTYHGKKLSEKEGFDESKWSRFRLSAANQFGFDSLFSDGTIKLGGLLGRVLSWIDKWIIDGIVNLVGVTTRGVAGTGKWIQTGFVRSYALLMQFGAILLIAYVLYLWFGGGAE